MLTESFELDYEQRLPAHTYAGIRVDGKSFSKKTRGLRKDTPFNSEFTEKMHEVARLLLEEVDGAFLAYVGSDEVSVLLHDLPEVQEKWFGGRVQKIASVASSVATAAFNSGSPVLDSPGYFDARVFNLGVDYSDVLYYLKTRRLSFVKNSVSMVAAHYLSHRQTHGVSTKNRIDMLTEVGVDWEEFPDCDKFGTVLYKTKELLPVVYERDGVVHKTEALRTNIRTRNPARIEDFENLVPRG